MMPRAKMCRKETNTHHRTKSCFVCFV